MTKIAVWCGLGTTMWVALLMGQSPENTAITAIGCINRATPNGSVGGTAGLPPAPPAMAGVLANSSELTNVFLLNGATPPDASKATRARAATGHTPAAVPTVYVLNGKAQDFEVHLGHRVEVIGTLLPPNESGPQATKSNIKHIRVTSTRMLAPTCPIATTEPAAK
jgi:hypothetical protein